MAAAEGTIFNHNSGFDAYIIYTSGMAEIDPLRIKVTRFLLVGGLNTLLMYLLYLGLIYIGFHYILALVAEYVCGIVLGFVMNRYWTFASHGRQENSFYRYALTYVGVFMGNLLLLALIVELGLLGPALGQLVAFGLVTVAAFLSQNYWVFRSPGS
jgi:putative flippase GtrA